MQLLSSFSAIAKLAIICFLIGFGCGVLLVGQTRSREDVRSLLVEPPATVSVVATVAGSAG